MMKKTFIRTMALALVLVLTLALISCGEPAKPFARGTTAGNVYTSEFASLTFTKPADWGFYSDSEIESLLGVSADIMEKDLDKMAEASIIDAFAYSRAGDNVNILYGKGSAFTSVSKTLEASFNESKAAYDNMGLVATKSDVTAGKIGTHDCNEMTVTITGAASMTQYFYAFKEGNYVVVITCTAVGNNGGVTKAQFEDMFS